MLSLMNRRLIIESKIKKYNRKRRYIRRKNVYHEEITEEPEQNMEVQEEVTTKSN